MAGLRISVVQYLNTAPLAWGMLHGQQQGRFEIEFTLPARCADDLRARKADAGIIPSIEYLRIEGLEIVPGISIASKECVKSVIVVSKAPLEEVRTVAMDNSSRTSVALTTILLRKFYNRNFKAIPADPNPAAMLRQADAALLIGDPALKLSSAGSAFHIYDLAALWKKFTGLPFVFALWAGHRESGIGKLSREFTASRDYGLAHIPEIAKEYAPRLAMSPEEIEIYLTQNIDYTLDEDNLKGLSVFFELAREFGLGGGQKEPEFASSEALGAKG
ncbi:MAG: menaquinone biosynthetic enzyme MqnA/MqnD family protein [Terriglobia bacterium]